MVVPGYPQSGPVGIIAGFLLGVFIYRRWFSPDAESLIKGGNMKPMGRFILMFVVYWIVSEAAGMFLDGTQIGLPSFASVCTAITAGFMNLHPHAVLNRVLWRWYQSPSGFKPLRVL